MINLARTVLTFCVMTERIRSYYFGWRNFPCLELLLLPWLDDLAEGADGLELLTLSLLWLCSGLEADLVETVGVISANRSVSGLIQVLKPSG